MELTDGQELLLQVRRAEVTAHLRVYAEAGGWTVEILDDHRRLVFTRPLRGMPGTSERVVINANDRGEITFTALSHLLPCPDGPPDGILIVALGPARSDKRATVLNWLH